MHPGPGGHRGELTAWDPVAMKPAWKIKESFPVWSGTLVTAGDVVFYGTMDGWFKALDAKTGKLLWQFKTGSGVIGQPISYRGPDGKQYVAIFAGVGGWAGAVVSADRSSIGVSPPACTSWTSGSEILPSGRTGTVRLKSVLLHTAISITSSSRTPARSPSTLRSRSRLRITACAAKRRVSA